MTSTAKIWMSAILIITFALDPMPTNVSTTTDPTLAVVQTDTLDLEEKTTPPAMMTMSVTMKTSVPATTKMSAIICLVPSAVPVMLVSNSMAQTLLTALIPTSVPTVLSSADRKTPNVLIMLEDMTVSVKRVMGVLTPKTATVPISTSATTTPTFAEITEVAITTPEDFPARATSGGNSTIPKTDVLMLTNVILMSHTPTLAMKTPKKNA